MNRLKFKGKWRSYQQQTLDNLAHHLTDSKLHIVAAPGAGKTTLGIEVIARLQQPVLIFAPTLTIRNQWKERIISAFLPENPPDIISMDIRQPKPITITTYQAMWSALSGRLENAHTGEPDEDSPDLDNSDQNMSNLLLSFSDTTDFELNESVSQKNKPITQKMRQKEIITLLKKQKITLLCFDEAHHLRNEWWQSLNILIKGLKPKQTLSLTATPPYDVPQNEWDRYEKICGPIDDYISIPELVKNGDLCPHQDYVYFSNLTKEENTVITELENKVHRFTDYLNGKTDFAQMLAQADVLKHPQNYMDFIYEDSDFFVSLISYLHHLNCHIPTCFLKLFDLTPKTILPFTVHQGELFISGLLNKHRPLFSALETDIADIESMARQNGILYRNMLTITENPVIRKQLSASAGKINAISTIIQSEHAVLKEKLRLVVLADYIREDIQYNWATSLGVVPIFMKTIQDFPHIPTAVLTGRIIIIPNHTQEVMLSEAYRQNIKPNDIRFKPFKNSTTHSLVIFSDSSRNKIVKLMTDLFNRGVFQILIGTQALLGEGWDAPSLNTLILSSTIASYMSSNQMRGRAIRTDKNNPDKTANIWHLGTLKQFNLWNMVEQKTLNYKVTVEDFGFDLKQLEKRFIGYEAPTHTEPYHIQNGLERLALGNITPSRVEDMNRLMLERSKNRRMIAHAWQNADITLSDNSELLSGIEPPLKQKMFVYKGTFLFLLCVYGVISAGIFGGIRLISTTTDALLSAGTIGGCLIGRLIYKYLRNGSIEGSMKSVISVVLKTLIKMGEIKTDFATARIKIKRQTNGKLFCTVRKLRPIELCILTRAVQEILNPIDNPRYLIKRGGIIQKDYHAIPEIIGTNKSNVLYFKRMWQKYIGRCQIIYTRSPNGKKLLLKAKRYAFANDWGKRAVSRIRQL